MSIVQKAHGSIAGNGGTISFANPTSPGNAVLIVLGTGAPFNLSGGNITDDSGSNQDYLQVSLFAVCQNSQVGNDPTLFMTYGTSAGGTLSLASMKTVTFANFSLLGASKIWMYEIGYSGSPDTGPPAVFWNIFSNPINAINAVNTSANPVVPDTSQVPGDGGDTGTNFYLAGVLAGASNVLNGNITAVTDGTGSGTVWTLDTTETGMGVAYAEAVGTGDQQAKFTNGAGSQNYIALYVLLGDVTSGLCGVAKPVGDPYIG